MLKIITDSSAEISQEEARTLDVTVVPLTVTFGAEAFRDGIDIGKEEFYRRLSGGEFPHTSQPNEQQFSEVFAQTEGKETLVLLISSALSGAMNSARLAKEEGGFTNVYLFETRCTSAMLRILVEAAVKNREKSAKEVIAILEELRPRIKLIACLNTLEYLRKGGRIKRSVAIVGDLIGIKPIIEITQEGTVGIVGKTHGSKKALSALVEAFRKAQLDVSQPVFFLQTQPDTPTREVMKAVGRENDPLVPICCAVGAHIGQGAAGIVYVVKSPA